MQRVTIGSLRHARSRTLAFTLLAALASASCAVAAELPSQNKKPKPPEAVKHCDVAGSPGVLAANGVCIRISGSISAGVNAQQVK